MPRSDAVMSSPPRPVTWHVYCAGAPPRDVVEGSDHLWTEAMQHRWDQHVQALTTRPQSERVADLSGIPQNTDRYGGMVWAVFDERRGFTVYRCPVCGSFVRRVEV